jgi:hypothetical protein
MDVLIAAGMGLFVASSLVTGGALLALSLRTREVPEFAIGMALFAGGGLAFPLVVLSGWLLATAPLLAAAGLTVATFLGHLGAASLALAVRHVFRPEVGWARVLQILLTTALAGAIALRVLEPGTIPTPGYAFWPGSLASLACYAWSAAESLLRWRTLRRDAGGGRTPEAARRFLMWGVAATAACGILAGTIAGREIDPLGVPRGIVLGQALLGVVAALGIWRAFFPIGRAWRMARTTAPHPVPDRGARGREDATAGDAPPHPRER